jgi:hypothetical protein
MRKAKRKPNKQNRKSPPSAKAASSQSPTPSNGALAHGKSSRPVKGKTATPPSADSKDRSKPLSRMIPRPDELRSLYQRYTAGSSFDDHDKAFYFALDVGGVSRAKQLLAHVEEVLAELEEFRG